MDIRMDDSRMPVRLGSILRVPDYAYPNWGLEPGSYRAESDAAYATEWEGGSPRQMGYVIEALKAAGMDNFSQMLRDRTAGFVSEYVAESKKRVKLLDVGAGVSTVNIWDTIDDNDKDRVTVYMLEPSKERVEKAAQTLVKDRGMKRRGRRKNLIVRAGRDLDIPKLFKPETFDVITGVATFHHHAYMDEPVRWMAGALKKEGYWVSADWHNSMWESPNSVYRLLEGFDPGELNWPTKKQDLAAFRQAFPLSENPPTQSARYARADGQISTFWEGWAKARRAAIQRGEFDEKDDILMLEGHRPRRRYIEYMTTAGLVLRDIEPLLPGSELLLFMTGIKG